jgi:hypothetical protein
LALDGVPRNVATFAPKPATPVEIGNPVALVRVPPDGVPSAPPSYRIVAAASGNVYTRATVGPAAVKNAIPVPPFAVGRIPVTPVVSGRPVALVSVPDDGVPNAPPSYKMVAAASGNV